MRRALLKRYGLPLGVLLMALVLDVFAYAAVWAPNRSARETADAQWRAGREAIEGYKAYQHAFEALTDITARAMPKTDLPKVVTTVAALAKKRGLAIPNVSYQAGRFESTDFQQVGLSFTVSGPYGDVRRFIHDLERNSPFVAVEGLSLSRAKPEATHLDVQLRVNAYLRNG